jgi:hypothetical protein
MSVFCRWGGVGCTGSTVGDRNVTPGDQGIRHQRGADQFAALPGGPCGAFRSIGVPHPEHQSKISRQLFWAGEVFDSADGESCISQAYTTP